MKKMNVTSENFSAIREALKNGESVNVNDAIVLVSFQANTETINPETGKKTRTPFYYVAEGGNKYTSTRLKEVLGIETEKKGTRTEVTFEAIWEQIPGLAKAASIPVVEAAYIQLGEILATMKAEAAQAVEARKAALLAELAEMGVTIPVQTPKKKGRK